MDSLHLIEEAEEGPGLIQIWNIGKLNQALYVYRVRGLGLWYLADLSTIFQYCGYQFYW